MCDFARENPDGGGEQCKMLLALVFPSGPRGQHQLCAWVIIMGRDALEQMNRRVAAEVNNVHTTDKLRSSRFLIKLSRQQLLASTIPGLSNTAINRSETSRYEVEAPTRLEELMATAVPTNPEDLRRILQTIRLQIMYDTGMELDKLRLPLRRMEIAFDKLYLD